MTRGLLDEIEKGALDGKTSVADVLRKCVALGGRSGSAELRTWALRELRGYESVDEVPPYRRIQAPIAIDGVAGFNQIRAQQISSTDLPEILQEKGVSETLPLMNAIGEIEDLARRATSNDKAVHLGLPGGNLAAQALNAEWGSDVQQVMSVYWSVSPSALFGVVDQVRTTLVEFVAELRRTTSERDVPPAKDVSNAMNLAVYGAKARVSVNAPQTGSGTAQVSPIGENSPPWYRTTRAIWSFIVGGAAIVSAVIAWITLD